MWICIIQVNSNLQGERKATTSISCFQKQLACIRDTWIPKVFCDIYRARTRQIKASKIVISLTELSRNHKKASELFFVKAVLRLNQCVKKRAELRLISISGLFFKVASPKLITAVPLRLLMKFFTHKNHSKLAH